jgi:hypothetical protein
MKSAPILAALLAMATVPAMAAPETRSPTDAETTSLNSYYRQQYPSHRLAKPVFSITRDSPKSAWTISATSQSAPQRGLRSLCRMNRTDFHYAGRWSAGDTARQFVWLEWPGCTATARAVELLQPMPDTDVIGLLERQTALLHSARILLGGNSACASQRSYRFALARITVGTSGPSPEVLAGLVFKSDHDTLATVWAKRNGLEYTPWNVSCP